MLKYILTNLYAKCFSNPVILYCDIQSPAIVKRMYSWLGMFELNNHSYLATNDYCPLDYCKSSFLAVKSNAHNLMAKMSSVSTTGLEFSVAPAHRDRMELGVGKL